MREEALHNFVLLTLGLVVVASTVAWYTRGYIEEVRSAVRKEARDRRSRTGSAFDADDADGDAAADGDDAAAKKIAEARAAEAEARAREAEAAAREADARAREAGYFRGTGGEHVPPPPERSMPVNVHTRGRPGQYQQVGTLRDASSSSVRILPLYGRPTYPSSHKWNYFTTTDGYNFVRLPVHSNSKDCSSEYGCDELYDGDQVVIPEYGAAFEVSIYNLSEVRYIPY